MPQLGKSTITLSGLITPVVRECDNVLKSWDGTGLPTPLANPGDIKDHVDSEVWLKIVEFKSLVDEGRDCRCIVDDLGISLMARIGFAFWPETFQNFLKHHASLFTKHRVKITHIKFLEKLFNRNSIHPATKKYQDRESNRSIEKIRKKIWDIVFEEEKRQCKEFPQTNFQFMDLDQDHWTLFWTKTKGTSLQSASFDFSVIKSTALKKALMAYLKYKRWKNKTNFRSQNIVGMVARALNFLADIGVEVPDDVKIVHVRKLVHYLFKDAVSYKGQKLSPSSVRAHFKVLRPMWDFLLFSDENLPDLLSVRANPFTHVSFKNERKTYQSADYIPEEVIDQIVMYHHELPTNVWRCFQIMIESGLRFQDAYLLEKGCLTWDEDIGCHILKAVTHKNRKARIKRGLKDYILIGLTAPDGNGNGKDGKPGFTNAIEAIEAQEKETAAFRAESGSDCIFLTRPENFSRSNRICMLSAHGFTEPIRVLIRKYNITDHDGNLWLFKKHQCRKTVAVTMVKNGATEVEMMQFLGHINQRTTLSVYAEVRKMDLANLNHEFFEKKFNTTIPEEHLERFNAEERKLLYVEFALGYRDVELGQCTKHASDGPCGKRQGKITCAICPQICTGPQYLPKWFSLVEAQKAEIAEYEKAYEQAGIVLEEYASYREYERAVELLDQYDDGLGKILAYERN